MPLALWKKSYDRFSRHRIKKQRQRSSKALPAKVHIVKAMVFPLAKNGCESWKINKAQHLRTDAYELWCWRRRLSIPWPARRSNQSILKENNPEYSLKGLMLKLKLQYFCHLMSQLIGKKRKPDAGENEGKRRRGNRG